MRIETYFEPFPGEREHSDRDQRWLQTSRAALLGFTGVRPSFLRTASLQPKLTTHSTLYERRYVEHPLISDNWTPSSSAAS